MVSYGMCGEPKVSDQLRKPTQKAEAPTAFALVEPGFANADPMCTNYPSLELLRKLSKHRPEKAATTSARTAAPPGK